MCCWCAAVLIWACCLLHCLLPLAGTLWHLNEIENCAAAVASKCVGHTHGEVDVLRALPEGGVLLAQVLVHLWGLGGSSAGTGTGQAGGRVSGRVSGWVWVQVQVQARQGKRYADSVTGLQRVGCYKARGVRRGNELADCVACMHGCVCRTPPSPPNCAVSAAGSLHPSASGALLLQLPTCCVGSKTVEPDCIPGSCVLTFM